MALDTHCHRLPRESSTSIHPADRPRGHAHTVTFLKSLAPAGQSVSNSQGTLAVEVRESERYRNGRWGKGETRHRGKGEWERPAHNTTRRDLDVRLGGRERSYVHGATENGASSMTSAIGASVLRTSLLLRVRRFSTSFYVSLSSVSLPSISSFLSSTRFYRSRDQIPTSQSTNCTRPTAAHTRLLRTPNRLSSATRLARGTPS